MSRFAKGFFALLVVGAAVTGVSMFGENAHAAMSQPANRTEAINRVNWLCSQRDGISGRNETNKVAHAAYINGTPKLNETTGAVSYQLTIIWRGCGNGWNRMFAVTGYPTDSSNAVGAVCPNVGTYGQGGSYPTHDCIKYIGSPAWTNHSTLSCNAGRDEQCVNGWFDHNWGGGQRVRRVANEPSNSIHSISMHRTGSVKNWNQRTKTSGSQNLTENSSVCSFYITYVGDPGVGGRQCQDLQVNVSWSRPWTINGQSYIKNSPDANRTGRQQGTITATPGDRLNWYHDMTNNGDHDMDRDVYFNVDKTGFSNGWNGIKNPTGNARGAKDVKFVYEDADHPDGASPYTLYDVTQNDVGNTLCQNIAWRDRSWNQGGVWGLSTPACASVPYNYELVPKIANIADNAVIEPGQQTTDVVGVVDNLGPTKSHTDTRWQMTQIIFGPSQNPTRSAGGRSAQDPCSYYYSYDSCRDINNGVRNNAYPGNGSSGGSTSTNVGSAEVSIDDIEVGSRICFALSVQRNSSASTSWRHSELRCMIIGKRPKVQVHGGALQVGQETGTTSIAATSVTEKRSRSETVAAPSTAITGLWRTGVASNGAKLGENVSDPHWEIDRVYRTPGRGGATCQRGYNASGSYRTIPTTANSRFQARTIVENALNVNAGRYIIRDDNPLTGNNTALNAVDNSHVWERASSNARWIGQNLYGQNWSSNDCNDPTRYNPSDIENSNIYVFKLKQPIQVDSQVNLNSIRLTVRGAIDNQVKFYVNGCELVGTYSPNAQNWQEPGWNPSSVAGARAATRGTCAHTNGFRHGANTFEVHVRSTYSHTGLLIDQFTASATVNRPLGNVFGSWTEYGVFASGRVEGLASASGLNGGVTNAAQSGWSALTYANTDPSTPCTATQFGCYRLARSELPDITSYFQSTTATTLTQTSRSLQQLATAAVGSPAGDSRGGILKKRATTPNTLTLSNGNPSTGAGEYQLPQGRWIVLNMPDTTVNITGNLKYTTDSLSNIASIPQLIIIAKDINIAASVTQVDAWLIASGGISTCTSGGTAQSGGATALTARICDEALTINGPVLTDKLYLRRTAGSGTGDASGDPAEVINLRPDAHMWVRHYIESGAVLRASGTRELPPRF